MSTVSPDPPGTPEGWWLLPGPAICPACQQPHQIEAMLYCSRCDGSVCAVCVILSLEHDPCCPACHGTSAVS